MMPSLSPEEGAPASPCVTVSQGSDAGIERTVASPVRHMHSDVAELLQAARTTPRRRRRKKPAPPAAADEARGRVRYDCAFEEEAQACEDGDRFAPPRLVWAKVTGYPWWPGQVFDESDASNLALQERRNRHRDAILVACFGDRSFLWADAEDLLPLRDDFTHLAEIGGRSKSRSAFTSAVNDVLNEVSRRAEAGLSCGCRAASIKEQVSRRVDAGLSCGCRAANIKKLVSRRVDAGRSCGSCAASIKKQDFLNSGLRRGARGATVDAAFAKDAFRGEAFVRYVRALAVAPTAGADMLDLAIASAQLDAFTRWRSVAPPTDGAMVVAGRATTPRRGDRGDAPSGDMAMSLCARVAAADAAFMRDVFRGEAPEECNSVMALTPPPAGSQRRELAVSSMAQPNAFSQWRGAPSGIFTECTSAMDVPVIGAMDAAAPPPVRHDTANKMSSGDDAEADPGNCRILATSCISNWGDSACEDDGDDGSETESEDFEVSSKWGLGWKDYVILMQFVAIVLLVCQLMQ
ncbi:unnamed protein product [Alopecurus aequalis]